MKERNLINRNSTIDGLRGIAIMLVVIGHVIQYVFSPNTFDDNLLFRVIYSFHMPLFMFISGYTIGIVHPALSFILIREA